MDNHDDNKLKPDPPTTLIINVLTLNTLRNENSNYPRHSRQKLSDFIQRTEEKDQDDHFSDSPASNEAKHQNEESSSSNSKKIDFNQEETTQEEKETKEEKKGLLELLVDEKAKMKKMKEDEDREKNYSKTTEFLLNGRIKLSLGKNVSAKDLAASYKKEQNVQLTNSKDKKSKKSAEKKGILLNKKQS